MKGKKIFWGGGLVPVVLIMQIYDEKHHKKGKSAFRSQWKSTVFMRGLIFFPEGLKYISGVNFFYIFSRRENNDKLIALSLRASETDHRGVHKGEYGDQVNYFFFFFRVIL